MGIRSWRMPVLNFRGNTIYYRILNFIGNSISVFDQTLPEAEACPAERGISERISDFAFRKS